MRRTLAGLLMAGALAASLGPTLAAQPPAGAGRSPAIPRLADGHPDMQGVWIHGTLTPFERPVDLGTKAFYTAEELRTVEAQIAARRNAARTTTRAGDVGGDNEAFVDSDYAWLSTRQTSLLVEPPDGRLPVRPDALKRAAVNLESRDDPETMSPWDRCITRGPTLMLPAGYNNGTRIVQTPGLVTLEAEMVHEVRVIPTDGRPHVAGHLRTWLGDPRGRWEGDTLVIDSTNFHDRGWISTHAGSGRLRGLPNSEALHVVERFTMTAADTIVYEMTVDDPAVYTRPWTVSVPLTRDDTYVIYEAACHEGNQAIELVLRGARFEERQVKSPPGKP